MANCFIPQAKNFYSFLKSQLQNFCYQAELHATLPHCAKGRFAFLCNEAKNNYVLVFLKQESSEVYENGMLGAIYASFVYYDLQ